MYTPGNWEVSTLDVYTRKLGGVDTQYIHPQAKRCRHSMCAPVNWEVSKLSVYTRKLGSVDTQCMHR